MYYYFTASTKRLKEDADRYRKIINTLDRTGSTGLNYVHFAKNDPERIKIEDEIKKGIVTPYTVQTSLIDKADFLVVDLINETVTIGYQIDYATRKKIPVLVLVPEEHRDQIPVMLMDDHTGLLTLQFYKDTKEIEQIVRKFLSALESGRIKFNFFINIPINNYLNQRSEMENRPKSDIVRELILQEMGKHPINF